ncbi:nucleoside-diphosphate sugar epimerase/dehydratase [Blastococcus saxobsidens]|uniref:nucleoside-diphosphate sugar epimerase/dehydratase n=1 Tax=Blastococcus saxobsidens TaxID=138336 RepID=UPI0002DB1DFA|nr:nucleoside-diphosphate sugar epimerase/dehydratase [Blastococcus saxobsidens]
MLPLQDTVLLTAALVLSLLFRYDGAVPSDAWAGLLSFVPLAIAVFVGVNAAAGVYGHLWRYASVVEARRVLVAGGAATLIMVAIDLVPRFVPLTVALVSGLVATMFVGLARFQTRLVSFRRRSEQAEADTGMRVLVIGAGRTGAELIRQMQTHGHTGLLPVAVLDNDARTWGRLLSGVRVLGGLSELPRLLAELDVHQIVLADPETPTAVVERIAGLADDSGVVLRVLPGGDELVRSGLRLQDVRDLRIDDLLGREPVGTDLVRIASMLQGRRVLVTGAGGSIGSEICRQVARCAPERLVLLDHDETHLHDALATLPPTAVPELVDIRDAERLNRAFARHRPDVVFHAAAHKHVPMLETAPSEAVMTNVVGTGNVVAAAAAVDVPSLVLISTDKAVRPSSVMGASKSVAEDLVLTSARNSGRAWCGVRFGNVLGSRGSVIPTFSRQIQAGGPVTVTDARMTRYFMTIPEAVQLVLQAAAMSRGGELFMLEMGQPVSIIDLAHRMIRLSGRRPGTDVEIRISGTRPGEKLHEELSIPEEGARPTEHPSVLRLDPVLPSDRALAARVDLLRRLADAEDGAGVRAALLERNEAAEVAPQPNFVVPMGPLSPDSPVEPAAAGMAPLGPLHGQAFDDHRGTSPLITAAQSAGELTTMNGNRA